MMTEADKNEFAAIWLGINENYRATVTPAALRMAFEALKPVLTIDQCMAAAVAYMSDPDQEFPPRTNNLVAIVKGTAKEREGAIAARAEVAWVSLLAGRDKMTDTVGIAVMRGMAGVSKFDLDRASIKDVDFKRREFIANYLAYHHPDAGAVLAKVDHAKPALEQIAQERENIKLTVQKSIRLALAAKEGR